MQHIPDWIAKIVSVGKMKCNDCSKLFRVDDMISVGVQESNQPPHPDTLCIGMFCKKCREITIFELKEMTLIDFAFEVLDRETGDQNDRPAKSGRVKRKREKREVREVKRSKISSKEMRADIDFIRKVKSHEEFLIALGMSPSEIEKYNIKKTKHKK